MKKLIFLILLLPLLSIAQVPLTYDGKLVVLGSTFSPLDYTPIAWYDSQDLGTITKDGSNYVSKWDNKASGSFDLIQNTGANQPTYTELGILFDGVNDYLPVIYTNILKPVTIFVVFNQPTLGGNKCLYVDFAGGAFFNQIVNSSSARIYSGVSLSGTIENVNNNIFTNVHNGANSRFYQNNNLLNTGNSGSVDLGDYNMCFGSKLGTQFQFNGYIKEVVIYNSALTTEQISTVNAYLNLKYTIY